MQTIVIASTGLLLAAVIPLAREALTDCLTEMIAMLTVVLLLISEIDTLWIVLGSAVASLAAPIAGLVHICNGRPRQLCRVMWSSEDIA